MGYDLAMRTPRPIWLALAAVALVACGGRVHEQASAVDAGPAPEAAASDCPSCPDPSTVVVRTWCTPVAGPGPSGLDPSGQAPSCTCPSANAPPTCGTPFACTCGDELWNCASTTVPGCVPVCPPPSEVLPLGECNLPNDLTCPSSATYDGYSCSCTCSINGLYNCGASDPLSHTC